MNVIKYFIKIIINIFILYHKIYLLLNRNYKNYYRNNFYQKYFVFDKFSRTLRPKYLDSD